MRVISETHHKMLLVKIKETHGEEEEEHEKKRESR